MQEGIAVGSRRPAEMRLHTGATVPFDTICSPGAYVCNWSGHLLRIPERTVVPGEAPRMNIIGPEPLTVTKISDNPGVSLAEARTLAASMGVSTGF
ncbi:MAG: hypothetical protein KAY37_03705 [Phycisphaerae bacterium]|nr:hypothetical protein [Phycisphaerae bacterium]